MTRRLLLNNDYIKLNAYLYLKNIKSNIITGNFIIVNIKDKSCSYITLHDKFLWFNIKPTITIEKKNYSSLSELSTIIEHNNLVINQFEVKNDRH